MMEDDYYTFDLDGPVTLTSNYANEAAKRFGDAGPMTITIGADTLSHDKTLTASTSDYASITWNGDSSNIPFIEYERNDFVQYDYVYAITTSGERIAIPGPRKKVAPTPEELERRAEEEARRAEIGRQVYQTLFETNVPILKAKRNSWFTIDPVDIDEYYEETLDYTLLWVVSIASCVETRETQVIVTCWGDPDRPDPSYIHLSSPAVLKIETSVREFLAEHTY